MLQHIRNDMFTEADFAPSAVTDMFSPSADPVAKNIPSPSSVNAVDVLETQNHQARSVAPAAQPSIASAAVDLLETQEIVGHTISITAEVHHQPRSPLPEQHISLTVDEVPNQSSPQPSEHIIETGARINKANEQLHALSDPLYRIDTYQEEPVTLSAVLQNISNTLESHIPLINISPLPKATHIQTRRKKGSKSEIITGSPFKKILEEKQKKN